MSLRADDLNKTALTFQVPRIRVRVQPVPINYTIPATINSSSLVTFSVGNTLKQVYRPTVYFDLDT